MTRHDIYAGVQQRKRHGDAPGVRSPRKRRAGARRGSAPLAVLLALVMALAFPARAFASIYNNPQVQWTSAQSCVVSGPNNEFDAALAIIERTNTKIQISGPMYVELSNEGTGGRFYQLAKSLKCAADETPNPIGDFVLSASVSASVALCGADYVWWQVGITVSDDLISGALQDYETILNGGHLGGGGSDTFDGTLTMTPLDGSYRGYNANNNTADFASNQAVYASGNDLYYVRIPYVANRLYAEAYTIRFSDSIKNEVIQNINDGYDFLYCKTNYIQSRMRVTVELYCIKGMTTNDAVVVPYTYNGESINALIGHNISWSDGYKRISFELGVDSLLTTTLSSVSSRYTGTGPVTNGTGMSTYQTSYYMTGTGSGGGGGNNNWPGPSDEPEPGPPDPPSEPTDPVGGPIDWPQPYNPTIPAPGPEPTPTTPVTNPTNTSPADYTPWLMAILSELRGIHTDTNAWLDAIFEGIVYYGAAICSHIDTASENVRSTLRFMTQWMDEQLDTSFYQLRHLLWECANYIADSLDYTFVGPDVNVPGYDDSSVLYWLKRIYYKLGYGNVNTRPVDPVGDHDNWWDWIVQLIKNLILDLGMMGADFLSDMGDVLSEVVQKFPFSIPWDIAAYLTAFSTQPVTPVIVITMPAISGFLPQTQFTIDLHPYDDAMATVRAVEVIVFTFWLMWKCPILLDMMDTAKWGI